MDQNSRKGIQNEMVCRLCSINNDAIIKLCKAVDVKNFKKLATFLDTESMKRKQRYILGPIVWWQGLMAKQSLGALELRPIFEIS